MAKALPGADPRRFLTPFLRAGSKAYGADQRRHPTPIHTQTFIVHYAPGVELSKETLQKAGLTEAERATAFAVGCQHLAEPIRCDIERLQQDNPEPDPHRA